MPIRAITILLLVFFASFALEVNSDRSYEWWREIARDSAVRAAILTPLLYFLLFAKKHRLLFGVFLLTMLALPFVAISVNLARNTLMLLTIAAQPPESFKFGESFLLTPNLAMYLLKQAPSLHSPGNQIFWFRGDTNNFPLIIWSQRGTGEYSSQAEKDRAHGILKWLIESGEALDDRGPNGFAAIHESILSNDMVYLELLINAGANLSQTIDNPRYKHHGLDSIEWLNVLDNDGRIGKYSELRGILEKAYVDQGIECKKCIFSHPS